MTVTRTDSTEPGGLCGFMSGSTGRLNRQWFCLKRLIRIDHSLKSHSHFGEIGDQTRTPGFKMSDVSTALCDLFYGCLCCSAEPFCWHIFAKSND